MIFEKIFCGLDIGSEGIKASVVRVKKQNRFELLGCAEIPTRGFKKSLVSDLGEFSESIQHLLTDLTKKTAAKFKDVQLGLGGGLVEPRYSKAMIPLMDKASKVITTGDLKKVNKQARLLGIKIDEEILHDFPQQYLIDDTNRILNPAGLYGRKLGVTSLLVVSPVNLVGNILKAVNQAGYEAAHVSFSSFASAQTALTPDHIHKGCLLIDIGAATTNILFFKDGFLRHLDILPVGGEQLTSSISESLRLPFDLAEDIKKSHALVPIEDLKNDRDILVKKEEGYLTVKRKIVCAAIKPQVDKLLEGIQNTLKFSHIQEKLTSGIVMVGGGSMLSGLMEHIEKTTGLQVEIGKINIGGTALNPAAIFTAAVGLASASAIKPVSEFLPLTSPRNWMGSFSHRIQELYEEYF